jgi:hypothetical protein
MSRMPTGHEAMKPKGKAASLTKGRSLRDSVTERDGRGVDEGVLDPEASREHAIVDRILGDLAEESVADDGVPCRARLRFHTLRH